jgi:hypothetical protein
MTFGWRDQILAQFTPNISRLTLVADPDALLLEECILEGIRDRGFELIPFEDSIAFRYAYESGFRTRWDFGEKTDLVVLLRSDGDDLDRLPFDLLQAGRKLSFSLVKIFPNLSYTVVNVLDRSFFDALFDAQKHYGSEEHGESATKDFILRHVFQIAPEMIITEADLLRVLLRCHYRGLVFPPMLSDRIVQLLKRKDAFQEWPLDIIVPDREAFFAFLQERWPVFLDRLAERKDETLSDSRKPSFGFSYPGPAVLPFDHHDVRVFIDNLFLEGVLNPVTRTDFGALSNTWAAIGIQTLSPKDYFQRLQRMLESVQEKIPGEDARQNDWSNFARLWSEMMMLAQNPETAPSEPALTEIKGLQKAVDEAFSAWLLKRYAGLMNLPPVPPVMLHHVPRCIARYLWKEGSRKAALLVIDGMSLSQWAIIREELALKHKDLKIRESTVFSWVPTLSSVARQALFAGKAPIYFPNSIHTTNKEGLLWNQFWADSGLAPHEIYYERRIDDGKLDECKEHIDDPRIRIIGLTANQLDDIMHGMTLGASGMQNQVRQWAKQPLLSKIIEMLLDCRFRIFLTSDHGNIEASGCGRPADGVMANIRGERARVYTDSLTRKNIKQKYPEAVEWEPVGLPADYLPLIAPNRKAFVQEGKKIITHGGISIEELIVPFIQLEIKTE